MSQKDIDSKKSEIPNNEENVMGNPEDKKIWDELMETEESIDFLNSLYDDAQKLNPEDLEEM